MKPRPTARAELATSLPAGLLTVQRDAIEDLEHTLDRFLLYGQTVSSIVVSSPVPPRSLPVD
ncbi:MAG: hypothetical protein M3Y66_05240 [Actinomycetota bacterium]|nr:hypothetical protein [Actinomycetota bacterium]